jgi:ATP-dependent Lhr-like helicase
VPKGKTQAVTDPLAPFSGATRRWFRGSLGEPTRAQALAWDHIAHGRSVLLSAPTGSGKTLAAFLYAIDRLSFGPAPSSPSEALRVLYVSPLKALAVDVERNLRAPLAGIDALASHDGERVRPVTVGVRTGDTSTKERAAHIKSPPDILVTTPESLYLMLSGRARKVLASIDTVIVDEIHQLAGEKRGAHFFLSLERLEALREAARPTCPKLLRIGLSATQKPLELVAEVLGGRHGDAPREIAIEAAPSDKRYRVVVGVPEGAFVGEGALDPDERRAMSAWPKLHARLYETLMAKRSTMIFVNSRRLAERLASALNDLDAETRPLAEGEVRPPLALAHHGSLAHAAREEIEDKLKRGELRAIVATSSLELGIDMGAVDQVVQIESPPSVASGIQRIGRAGHSVGAVSEGLLLPKHKADLLAAVAAKRAIEEGDIEPTRAPKNPLDVLAQQIVAIVATGLSIADIEAPEPVHVDTLFSLVRRAAAFGELPRTAFDGVLDMLSGRYPSADFSELRPRLTWDRRTGLLRPRPFAKKLAVLNAGTIPERGLYGVFLDRGGEEGAGPKSRRVGELDEEMVFELREGDTFFLGASSWKVTDISKDRVLVVPAPGTEGRPPFWHGDKLGRAMTFGTRIGGLTRELASRDEDDARAFLETTLGIEPEGARVLAEYVHQGLREAGHVPTDKTIVVERFQDELGDHRICVLSPFGARVHAPWSIAIRAAISAVRDGDVEAVYSDDGITLRVPEGDAPPALDTLLHDPVAVVDLVTREVGHTALFAARFREAAGRALLLPKRTPGKRTPLWALRKKASDLMAVASRFPEFPLMLEVHRECLADAFDMPGLVSVLEGIKARKIAVRVVDTKVPSTFAKSLLFSFVGNFLYDGDAPLAERRAQALLVDPDELRALLGEGEMRKLLDPKLSDALEDELQRRSFRLGSADALHDLLLYVGDLSRHEVRARFTTREGAEEAIAELLRDKRATEVRIAEELRLVAVEDASRYRDGLGVVLPHGIPLVFLEKSSDPRVSLFARYARTHSPFSARTIGARYGLSIDAVVQAFEPLVRDGRVAQGAFLPEGDGSPEYADREILKALRRRTLFALRHEVAPVEAAVFARFSLAWHGVAPVHEGPKERERSSADPDRLLEAIERLEACPLPLSVLEGDVLPARVPGYRPWDLDALLASGEVRWEGIEALGTNDGRIALTLGENADTLGRRPTDVPISELAEKVLALFEARGALFFHDVSRAMGGFPNDLAAALHELVWAGHLTNDTLEPLRSAFAATHSDRRKTRPSRSLARTARRAVLPGTEGRFSVRPRELAATPTERRTALTRRLLERHGVLLREALGYEGVAGGFSALYDVLSALEDRGMCRRGYFVEGRGTTQFALPGADDRLRAARESDGDALHWVSAVDPAFAYGAALPFPETRPTAHPTRSAGAHAALVDGVLAAWVSRGGDGLVTFPGAHGGDGRLAADLAARALARVLAALSGRGKRAFSLRTIDGLDATSHPERATFEQHGFQRRGDALVLAHEGRGRADMPEVRP